MNTLLITQNVDESDSVLGFFVSWIKEISRNVNSLKVISFKDAKLNNIKNTKIYKIRKTRFKILRLFYFYKLYLNLLIQNQFDFIFSHMNPEYIILCYPLALIKNIPIYMWYSHKHIDLKLLIALKLSKGAFTTNPKSLRYKSPKIRIVGHAIDINKFKEKKIKNNDKYFKILSVGRISLIKNLETLIFAMENLVNKKGFKNIKLDIIGSPILDKDYEYFKKLKRLVYEKKLQNNISFIGMVPYSKIEKYYINCDLFVSTSLTESYDKVVLEAMACNIPVITSIYTFKELLSRHCIFIKNNYKDLSNKIEFWYNQKDKIKVNTRSIILNKFNLKKIIKKIIYFIKQDITNGLC
ncbi:MAG: glycosyltransferase family 4 protein [Candidatus Helarchaeota archaeon]